MIYPFHLQQVLYESLNSGSGRDKELGSIYIKGDPGIGKSDIVKSVVDRYNEEHGNVCQLIDLRLTICDPSDLRGMPYPDKETEIARWFPPDILPTEKTHAPKGILFFDDFTTAPQLVQAAAYQLFIQPHQLGNYQLPEGWVIVGAGNNTNTRSLANAIPKPLANRMIHINYEIDTTGNFKKHWIQWAFENDIDNRIVGFMQSPVSDTSKGSILYDFDPAKSDDAFATPRSWARVSAILERKFPLVLEKQLVEGTIGSGASSQFYQFVNYLNELPDIFIILDGHNVNLKIEKNDMKYAMIVALSNSIETVDHMNNAIEWAHQQEMEHVVLLLRMLDNKPDLKRLMLKTPALKKVGKALREMVNQTEAIKNYRDSQ